MIASRLVHHVFRRGVGGDLARAQATEEAIRIGCVAEDESRGSFAEYVVELRSDEHQAHPRAMARLSDGAFVHSQTSSKEARTPELPLFPVNLSDLLIRHCSANHKRETIAFSKPRQSALYWMAIWVVWRNSMKNRSENRRKGTPAQALGITRRVLELKDVLRERLFAGQISSIRGWLAECYFGRIRTRAIENCVEHRARFAI